jgi:hypothetical protein
MGRVSPRLQHPVLLWTVASVITLAAGMYQRMTGPTYPVSGSARIDGTAFDYRLDRSHTSGEDAPIRVTAAGTETDGTLEWRRHRTSDPWTAVPMRREGADLVAALPSQPPAGKLDYRILLRSPAAGLTLPAAGAVTTRFKGAVPVWLLIPHILVMFSGMLLSTRTGLEALRTGPHLRALSVWTLAVLALGGFLLGPAAQWYAFGKWWTGWPVGTDLTDNKTAIAILVWGVAAAGVRFGRRPGPWAIAAALVTLAVFLIPHSMFGTELDYSTGKIGNPAPR